ncbi:16S rRNA (guanine(966)-N(2))-methyltransferase RsmD [Pseudoluteimonas lycopersici]|uniref:Ribosomal RNA small subunit methyltransferase D n=1 Tax=Pseudoluteimonas lycopersici TaxID=1324796 RepID=A0A516V4E3_9GAMM|nr:16S rRNA (guanine(966)-N(2))-methyltransferase RsmD [Lysobacter lycopersici]QDQ73379.1 16S rRNA (guanine(966)-N(2))-methyltransferase RsmD [Lysobacter lycopersici]
MSRAQSTPGSVRIIGGRWRGTRLPVADMAGLRPTSDRVRETLFNWLASILPGARVLDLFAGSGALGLEALSRGAREAMLVERDAKLAESLRQSVAKLRAEGEAGVVVADALAFLRAPLHGRFDIVFLDPPFAADLWPAAFAALPPWLADDAWVYVESPFTLEPEPGTAFRLHREGRTREARYALYRRVTLPADPSEPGVPPE